jgi:type IV pilus assembly protein PilC
MAEFVVKMADERGRVLEQVESGHSAAELRDRFSHQGFLVYDIKPRSALSGGFRRKKLSREHFIIFNSQFVTLIHAGLPILMALELLAHRQKNAYFRSLLEDVRQRVKGGESLSQAWAAQNAVSPIYTTTLLAGEKSGNLEEVLNRYIAFQRISISFRKKFLTSLIYPTLLVVAMTVLFTILVVYILPQFGALYSELHVELPPSTLFLIDVGTAIQHYIVFIVVGAVALIFAFVRWKKTPAGANWIDNFRVKLPRFGEIWLKYQVAMFSRTLSTLLAGGLPLVPSLETAGSSMESQLVARAIRGATQAVREGRTLSHSLEETKVFPELAVEMVEVGESTGALPAMLTSAAEFYEEDVQTALAAALSLIEPLILIFMGVVVGSILLSLYMPIFSLGAQAGG